MVYSLDNVPIGARRNYFIYLLENGWKGPINKVLKKNYDRMVSSAANNKAVVIKGTAAEHFQNEVFSWHNINGDVSDGLLPALLITNKHPKYFKESGKAFFYKPNETIKVQEHAGMKMILIPFQKAYSNESEVIRIVESVFESISQGKDLKDFTIIQKQKKGIGNALVDSLILEPNISGVGINLKRFFKVLRRYNSGNIL